MSTTSTPPARADAPAAARSADRDPAAAGAGPGAAVRAFAVMLGGPVVLLTATATAAAHSLRAIRAGRLPRPGAAAIVGAAVAYRRGVRPWLRTWGATDAEAAMSLPGDETVPDAGYEQTRVVGIDAPASDVWPWIAQIGQDRGGFYSYTWLENLAGCEMRNADRVHAEWQQRAAGETVLLHPATGLKILRVEPGRSLALEGGWSLVLLDDGPERCRLVARSRTPGGAAGRAYEMLLELPHFIMERKMLLEIKRRAERAR